MAAFGRGGERDRVEERLQRIGRHVEAGEAVPFLPVADPEALLERPDLLRRDQPGVVVLVSGEREAVALDRVGDEARGPVVPHGPERVAHGGHVVAAEVRHQAAEGLVVVLVEQLPDAVRVAEFTHELPAPRRAALVREGRVARVGGRVDPVAERLAAGALERGFEETAVLEHLDAPVEVAERRLQTVREPVDHDRVEALPVVVDDPPHVAHVVLPRLDERLEDVPFVELGVAGQGDHPALVARRAETLQAHVVLDERREAGHRHAQPDRPGREVDVVGVLGARGIRLRTPEAAETLELVLRLAAQEVLDGVEDGARVRLDGHPVLRPQRVEVERRHQRDDRGGRGLVPAHLQPVARRTQVVRVVDHPDREPQHLPLQRPEALQIGRGRGRCGRAGRRRRGSHGHPLARPAGRVGSLRGHEVLHGGFLAQAPSMPHRALRGQAAAAPESGSRLRSVPHPGC